MYPVKAFSIALMILTLSVPHSTHAQGPGTGAASGRWYRGNTHVHTNESDGNASPAEVTRWYREHGYHFLVVTDHERITDPVPLNAAFGSAGRFLVIQGEEVTQQLADSTRPGGNRQAHVNGIGLTRVVTPLGTRGIAAGISMGESYAQNIAGIRAAGGVPQVNHPNFRWSVGLEDMKDLPDSTLFEVWNAQPHINNLGGSDGNGRMSLSTEALWDSVLTRGRLIYGVASDDAHKFQPNQLEDCEATRPGGGWVMVRADTLTPLAIHTALRAGQFYSTTGPLLAEYSESASEVQLRISFPDNARDDRRFLFRFIGRGGRVLSEVTGSSARYAIRGNEGYVRVSIMDSNGRRAWTQPVRVRPR